MFPQASSVLTHRTLDFIVDCATTVTVAGQLHRERHSQRDISYGTSCINARDSQWTLNGNMLRTKRCWGADVLKDRLKREAKD
jgi:hypothetical protein